MCCTGTRRVFGDVEPLTSLVYLYLHLTASTGKQREYQQSPSRGSVKFLLNSVNEDLTRSFPPSPDARSEGRLSWLHNEDSDGYASSTTSLDQGIASPASCSSPPLHEMDMLDPLSKRLLVKFFEGPFSDAQRGTEEAPGPGLPYGTLGKPQPDFPLLSADKQSYETGSSLCISLIRSILSKAHTLHVAATTLEEIAQNLHFLLTPDRTRKFLDLYFQLFHPSYPILHQPTFVPGNVHISLLASVVLMGAMYSHDRRETFAAGRVLDIVEAFAFSGEAFAAEHEIGNTLGSSMPSLDGNPNEMTVQQVQGAYLMTVLQYWAGSQMSRNRAVELRFNEIIMVSFLAASDCPDTADIYIISKVTRVNGLTHSRHERSDGVQDRLWIKKEC